MSQTLPQGRVVLTANEAAAYAVMLARVRAIGCYPITPQTLIVERLAELVAGRDDVEYTSLESEHSMFGYVIAAARTGVRTFTATSSQGLLYAHEQLHRASRERVPLVVVDVNRAVFAPWSIEPDLTDSMSQRDTGWIQLYCSSAQEVLDSVLCAYRIAETALLPVMVCAEGFLLSHTSEVLEIPAQDAVDAFIPELRPPAEWLLDPARPRSFSALPQPNDYYAFQRNVADAIDDARDVIATVASEFTAHFGRDKVAALELSGNPSAESVLVAVGTIGDTAQELLDGDDDGDDDLLVVRVHAYRPFPAAELSRALAAAAYVTVIDRAAAFGSLGPLGADVLSLGLGHVRAAVNFVCGLGGAEVTPATLRWALEADAVGRRARIGRARLRAGRGCSRSHGRMDRRDRVGGKASPARPRRMRRLRAGDQRPARARSAHGGKARVADRPRDPGLVLDDHRRRLPGQRIRRLRPSDSLLVGGSGSVRHQGRAAPARSRRRHGRGLGRRRLDLRHRLLGSVGGSRPERGHRLCAQRQRGVHEHRRAALRRDTGGRLDDDDAGELAEEGPEEGHRADHGCARDPVCRDARRWDRCRCCATSGRR